MKAMKGNEKLENILNTGMLHDRKQHLSHLHGFIHSFTFSAFQVKYSLSQKFYLKECFEQRENFIMFRFFWKCIHSPPKLRGTNSLVQRHTIVSVWALKISTSNSIEMDLILCWSVHILKWNWFWETPWT